MIQTKAIQGKTEDDWTFETKDVSVNEVWKQLVDIGYLVGDHLETQGIISNDPDSDPEPIISYVRPVNGGMIEVKIDLMQGRELARTMFVVIDKDGACTRSS